MTMMALTADCRIWGRVSTKQWMRLVSTPNRHRNTQIRPWIGAYALRIWGIFMQFTEGRCFSCVGAEIPWFFFLPTKGFCADLIAYCGMTTKRGEGKDQSKRAVTGPKAMAFECLWIAITVTHFWKSTSEWMNCRVVLSPKSNRVGSSGPQCIWLFVCNHTDGNK